MDEQGIDIEAISINPFWYHAERDKAEAVIKLQNEKLAALVAQYPDRFVAPSPRSPCSIPTSR